MKWAESWEHVVSDELKSLAVNECCNAKTMQIKIQWLSLQVNYTEKMNQILVSAAGSNS